MSTVICADPTPTTPVQCQGIEPHFTKSHLVAFVYQLMRDHLPAGTVEKIVGSCQIQDGTGYLVTNGLLAQYAENVVSRLNNFEEVQVPLLRELPQGDYGTTLTSLGEVVDFMKSNPGKWFSLDDPRKLRFGWYCIRTWRSVALTIAGAKEGIKISGPSLLTVEGRQQFGKDMSLLP